MLSNWIDNTEAGPLVKYAADFVGPMVVQRIIWHEESSGFFKWEIAMDHKDRYRPGAAAPLWSSGSAPTVADAEISANTRTYSILRELNEGLHDILSWNALEAKQHNTDI